MKKSRPFFLSNDFISSFKEILLLIVIIAICAGHTKASWPDTSVFCKVVKHGIADSKNFIISPTGWSGADWMLTGTISAATVSLIIWADQPIYNFSNTLHSPSSDMFFKYSEPLGTYYPLVAISAFALNSIIKKDNYSFETALIAAESFAFSSVAVQFVKAIPGRARPNNQGTTNPHQWKGPFFKGNSFYSGHTTSAFSVATVFAYRYKETVWVPVLMYGLATLSGVQRIYGNRHWASDVLFGAATGTATGYFLCKQWEKRPIVFFPSVTGSGTGITLNYNF